MRMGLFGVLLFLTLSLHEENHAKGDESEFDSDPTNNEDEPCVKKEDQEWEKGGDGCYLRYGSGKFTWHSAEAFCQENGATLASVHSEKDTEFLVSLHTGDSLTDSWIGFNFEDFEWTDKSTLDYENWENERINSTRNDTMGCVSFHSRTGEWTVNHCNTFLAAICKRKKSTGTSTPTSTVPVQVYCPDGWYTFGTKCYHIFGWNIVERENWDEAQMKCKSSGYQFLSIHSKKEQEFLQLNILNIVSRVWIGMNFDRVDQVFKWADPNAVVDFTNWINKEPPTSQNAQDACVSMEMASDSFGKWRLSTCDEKKAYVCVYHPVPQLESPGRDPAFCPDPAGWSQLPPLCYKAFRDVDDHLDWAEAQGKCKNFNGNLATLRDFAVAEYLRQNITGSEEYFWTGLQYANKTHHSWIGSASLNYYSNWEGGQPPAESTLYKCVGLSGTGYWKAMDCSSNHSFICEVQRGDPRITTLIPDYPCPRKRNAERWRDLGGRFCFIVEWELEVTWYEAKWHCQAEGGSLAIIPTTEDLSVLISFMKGFKKQLHIGMERMPNASHEWVDYTRVEYHIWSDNYTSQDTKECVSMTTRGPEWIAVDCVDQYGYICSAPKEIGEAPGLFPEGKRDTQISTTHLVGFALITTLVILTVMADWLLLKKLRRRKKRMELVKALTGEIFVDDKQQIDPTVSIQDQTELLSYDPKWEFPRARLKFGKTLGQGAFGMVKKAKAFGLRKDEIETTVAVKLLKDRLDINQQKALMTELKILTNLGHHVNVLNLLGAVTRDLSGGLMVIVEYCCYGNLRRYLLKNRCKFIVPEGMEPIDQEEMIEPPIEELVSSDPGSTDEYSTTSSGSEGERRKSLKDSSKSQQREERRRLSRIKRAKARAKAKAKCSPTPGGGNDDSSGSDYAEQEVALGTKKETIMLADLICYGYQCARGMEYLSGLKIVHRDLAARNVLLAMGNIVKICDFGLAKDLYAYPNYVKKKGIPLPIKWMSLESVRDRVFTSKSDVWSYGILLWECFSLGENPYPGVPVDENFYKKLEAGYRMGKPKYATAPIYQIMLDCWKSHPSRRPTFKEIREDLADILAEESKQYYTDVVKSFETQSPLISDTSDSKMKVVLEETEDIEESSGSSHYLDVTQKFQPPLDQDILEKHIKENIPLTEFQGITEVSSEQQPEISYA